MISPMISPMLMHQIHQRHLLEAEREQALWWDDAPACPARAGRDNPPGGWPGLARRLGRALPGPRHPVTTVANAAR